MNFVTTESRNKIVSLRRGDPGFQIQTDLTVCDRASFEISRNCPAEYKSIFITAINAGWLKPVAHVTEQEFTFMGLTR